MQHMNNLKQQNKLKAQLVFIQHALIDVYFDLYVRWE